MKLIPISDHIVVKLQEVERENDIIMYTEDTAPKPQQAFVVAVGPGYWNNGAYEPMPFKVNDRVLFQKHAGQAFLIDNENLTILEQNDVLAILEP